jgi:hypothetical protein
MRRKARFAHCQTRLGITRTLENGNFRQNHRSASVMPATDSMQQRLAASAEDGHTSIAFEQVNPNH